MASSSEQNLFVSGSGISRRSVNPAKPRPPPASAPLHADIDPPPRPRPVFQFLAFGIIIFFGSLQFFPATHFRDPSNPFRVWVPVGPNGTPLASSTRTPDGQQSNIKSKTGVEIERIHIVSWVDCLDLPMLAVLANSTLSSSRFPEHLHFHFFIPEGEDVRVSYYKMKVLFPHMNLNMIGQKEVIEKIWTVSSEDKHLWPSIREIVPFVIPRNNPSLRRFLYVSPDTIIKESIEELFGIDLGRHVLAASEDCNKILGDYVSIDILNAIQRTAAKTWVSGKPYDVSACSPDLNVFLLDANNLDEDFMDSILWWSKVLQDGSERLQEGSERNNKISPSIAVAMYDKYLKLSATWKRNDLGPSQRDNETKVLHFDGARRICTGDGKWHQESSIGNIWLQYLTPKSQLLLSH